MSLDRRTFLKLPALAAAFLPFGLAEGGEPSQFSPKEQYGNVVVFLDGDEEKALDVIYDNAVNFVPPGYRGKIKFSIHRHEKCMDPFENLLSASWGYKP